jgi:membrane-associated protease RseP (regulator of RpoE activity)
MLKHLHYALHGLMEVESITVLQEGERPLVEFKGHLADFDPDTAFEEIYMRLEGLGYIPLLQKQDGYHILKAVPGVVDKRTGKPWVNAVLFLVTLISVLIIGAWNEGADLLNHPLTIWKGLPFAATLLGILTMHELSHYFVGIRYGSPLSLPYFIPLPFVSIFGTMGAVIVQKGPMRSRKALFDIGAAGPLGGLLLAIPLLVVGLLLSEVKSLANLPAGYMEGNSILYFLIKLIIFGQPLPSGGMDVLLHPMAFAAWGGLLVTALNLFPIGQLDGGHIAYAMWGRKAWKIARLFLILALIWGGFLVVSGNPAGYTWIAWWALGSFMGAKHPAPLNDVTPLDRKRKQLGWLITVIFLIILVPIPLTVITH